LKFLIKESEDQSSYIVFKKDSTAKGKESSVLLGNGVLAKCIETADGKVIAEYMFDKNKFTKDAAKLWTRQNADIIEKSIQESSPKGSFDDTTLRVQDAINASGMFPKDEYGNSSAYIRHMFDDNVIVSSGSKYYKVKYTLHDDKTVSLEAAVVVTPEYIEECKVKEAAKKSGNYFDLHENYINSSLKEAKFDSKSRKLIAVLIEKGMNFDKKRFYPDSTIKESAPLFAGIKMFIDHPTDQEDREKPERSVRDEVAIIEKSWYEDGKVMAQVHVHDVWLAEKLLDDVFRENAGLSINASGKRSYKIIDGVQVEVIEKIASPRSVDWVTEAGARGRVAYLLESAKHKKGESDMKFEDLTLTEVKANRPDLVESIRTQVKEEMKTENQAVIKEAVDAEVKKITEKNEAEKAQGEYQSKVKGLIEKSKLPEAAITKLCEVMKSKTFVSEADLETQVKESVQKELAYLTSIGGVKLTSDGAGKEDGVKESAAKNLRESLGIKEKKKEDDE